MTHCNAAAHEGCYRAAAATLPRLELYTPPLKNELLGTLLRVGQNSLVAQYWAKQRDTPIHNQTVQWPACFNEAVAGIPAARQEGLAHSRISGKRTSAIVGPDATL